MKDRRASDAATQPLREYQVLTAGARDGLGSPAAVKPAPQPGIAPGFGETRGATRGKRRFSAAIDDPLTLSPSTGGGGGNETDEEDCHRGRLGHLGGDDERLGPTTAAVNGLVGGVSKRRRRRDAAAGQEGAALDGGDVGERGHLSAGPCRGLA